MKRIVIAPAILLLLLSFSAFAQEEGKAFENTPKLKAYGFIRNYLILDTKENYTGSLDVYYYGPKDSNTEQLSLKLLALTTRVGADLTGLQYGNTRIGGKIEADFYCMNGSVASLRLRQAYITTTWENLGYSGNSSIRLLTGQAWHPMAADLADVIALETGSPFGPFSRTPQITMDYRMSRDLVFTASLLYVMQFLPTGPEGKSADYMKYGVLPEIYAGLSYTGDDFLARAGLDIFSIKPRWENGVSDRLVCVSPFVYAQYSSGSFRLKFKSILAQAGEHMNLLSGYGVSAINSDGSREYTPQRSTASFITLQYGNKWQVSGLLGYIRLLGTTKELSESTLNSNGEEDYSAYYYFNSNGGSNMLSAIRFTPTIAYNIGKFQFALEYNITSMQYGEGALGKKGLATGDSHWVTNHRLMAMTKLTF